MHLHSVIISFNRLELLKQCYHSYKETVTVPYTLVIVDNRSDNTTRQWLTSQVSTKDQVVFLEHNHFPGYACNRGWELLPAETTHLHRSDNDFCFLPYWCGEVGKRFKANPKLGQLGLRTGREENWHPLNVGGNNVIRRELWDRGLRYDERPWTLYPPGFSEDSLFSPAVEKMGYQWARVKRPCISQLAPGDWNDPYYAASWGARRIERPTDDSPGTR